MSEFRVTGVLGLDGSGFIGGLGMVDAALNRFAGRMARLFSVGAIGGTIAKLAKDTISFADEMEEAAKRLGTTPEWIQEMQFAARQSGVELSKMETFFKRMLYAASDLENADLFSRLGINTSTTPQGLYNQVLKATQGKSNSEIMQMFGGLVDLRQLGGMTDLLAQDFDKLRQTAHNVGAVMDANLLHSLAAVSDQFSVVGQIMMVSFAPAMVNVGLALLELLGTVKGINAWYAAKKNNLSDMDKAEIAAAFASNPVYGAKVLSEKLDKDPAVNAAADEAARKARIQWEEMLWTTGTGGAGGGEPLITPTGKPGTSAKAATAKMVSDSLVSVGNFMGMNGNNVTRIAERQLQKQEEACRLLSSINERINDWGKAYLGFP